MTEQYSFMEKRLKTLQKDISRKDDYLNELKKKNDV